MRDRARDWSDWGALCTHLIRLVPLHVILDVVGSRDSQSALIDLERT